jgi:hypothetical protein
LNIIAPLWSGFESRVRNRVQPPASLKQLEDVLQEEWYKNIKIGIYKTICLWFCMGVKLGL